MGRPLADTNTYVFGSTGIKVSFAKDGLGNITSDVFIYRQIGAKTFELINSSGTVLPGRFTLITTAQDGEPLDYSKAGEDLQLATCAIAYDLGTSFTFVEKILYNKIILSNDTVVYNNA